MASFTVGGDWIYDGANFTLNNSSVANIIGNTLDLDGTNLLRVGLNSANISMGKSTSPFVINASAFVLTCLSGLALTARLNDLMIDMDPTSTHAIRIGSINCKSLFLGNTATALTINSDLFVISATTSLTLNPSTIKVPNITAQAGDAGVPAIVLPAGFSYVVADITNKLFLMS